MQYDMPMPEGRMLPSMSLREIDLPEVIKWEVGDEYYVVMKIKMTGKTSGEGMGMRMGNDGSKVEGQFQVQSIRALGHEVVDAKSLESAEFNKVVAKIKSGEM